MTVKQLDTALEKTAIDFSTSVKLLYARDENEPATAADIKILSDQMFHALESFRKEIVTYLKLN